MLTHFFKGVSKAKSRLSAFWDTSEKLYLDRLAYKHELSNLEITTFDGNHLLSEKGSMGRYTACCQQPNAASLGT